MGDRAEHANQIFISYRRDDSAAITGRIYDRLVQKFGRAAIFKDVDSIPLGVNFRKHLDSIVAECAVVLVVIADRWAERLDDPRDFVRIEVESALRRDIPVIPLLVQNTLLPPEERLPESIRELSDRNGLTIGHDPHFNGDVNRLIFSLEAMLGSAPAQKTSKEFAGGEARGHALKAAAPLTAYEPASEYEPALDLAREEFIDTQADVSESPQLFLPRTDFARKIESRMATRVVALIFGGVAQLIAYYIAIATAAGALYNFLDRENISASDRVHILENYAILVAQLLLPVLVGGAGYFCGRHRPGYDWKGGLWVSAIPFVCQATSLIVVPLLNDPPYRPYYIISYTATLFATLQMPLPSCVGWYFGRRQALDAG